MFFIAGPPSRGPKPLGSAFVVLAEVIMTLILTGVPDANRNLHVAISDLLPLGSLLGSRHGRQTYALTGLGNVLL